MSMVIGAVLIAPSWSIAHEDRHFITAPVREWGSDRGPDARGGDQSLTLLDDGQGGTKCSGVEVYSNGFNHVLPDDVLAYFKSLPWTCPEEVVIYIECSEYQSETIIKRMGPA